MTTERESRTDYLTLLGGYELQRRRRCSVGARFRRWWIENAWAVLALVIIAVVFWLAVGDFILRYIWRMG